MSKSMQVQMVRVSDYTLAHQTGSDECDPLNILIALEEADQCLEDDAGYGECTLTIDHAPITFTR
jgi:hypothetical protein